jgi:hypothetical protein
LLPAADDQQRSGVLPCSSTALFTNCYHNPSCQGDKIVNVRLDLTDEKAVAKSLKDNQVEGVTHVFHTAFSGAHHQGLHPVHCVGFRVACNTHFALLYVSRALLQLDVQWRRMCHWTMCVLSSVATSCGCITQGT